MTGCHWQRVAENCQAFSESVATKQSIKKKRMLVFFIQQLPEVDEWSLQRPEDASGFSVRSVEYEEKIKKHQALGTNQLPSKLMTQKIAHTSPLIC